MIKYLPLIILSISAGFPKTIIFKNNWAKSHGYHVVSQSPAGIEIVLSLKQMSINDTKINGSVMKTISIPGVILPNQEGAPNLPGMGRYIAIPQGAKARVTIISSQTEMYHNIDLAPAPNIPLETDNSPLIYKKDMSIYGRNAYYPDNPVILSKPMKIRGVDVVILGITPFQYNPVTKELIVYKDLRVRVDFIGGNGHFGENRLRSPHWEPILQSHLLNYNSLPKINFYNPSQYRDGYEYIIIVPDDTVFERWGDTIKVWRKLQGISTEVFTLTEVGGSTAEAIEAFIDSAYNNWTTPPVAVLLLSDHPSSGDVYGIPSPGTDNIYADVDNDSLPDLNVARICAQTETHLDVMINKFLSYERSPYTDPGFYDHPLTASWWQTERWFQLTSEVIRGFWINEMGKNPVRQYSIYSGTPSPGCPWSSHQGTQPVVQYWYNTGWLPDTLNPYDTSWWQNGSVAGINAAINSGTFIFELRIFDYQIEDLAGLHNDMFPFAFLMGSVYGHFANSTPSFVEVWHRMINGGLGAIAATGVDYSFVNDTYNWGFFDGLWPEFDPNYPVSDLPGHTNLRPGFANVSAKYYLASSWMPDSAGAGSYRNYIYRLYHMHGDAFTTLYSEIPESLTVVHAPTMPPGVTSFTVQADDSSIIALTVDKEIIGVAEGTGTPVNITIPPQMPGSIVKVTVTKANYYRYEADVHVVGSHYGLIMRTCIVDDSLGGNNDGRVNPGETIDYGIWLGSVWPPDTVYSVYALLFASDSYVTLTIDSSWYGDVPADDSLLSDPFYNFSVNANCPNGHTIDLTLETHDINDSIRWFYPNADVYAPVLTYQGNSIIGGNGNDILDPGETVDIVVTIKNEGGAPAENVISRLQSLSSYVTVNDSLGSFGTIPPDSTKSNSADPYTVTADSATPTGTYADFNIIAQSGVYIDTLSFSIIIGKKHYYIWNPDPTPLPGQNMHATLTNLGYVGDYDITLAPDLHLYQAIFVCCGVYSNNYIITSTSPEATALADYLQNQAGRVYLEGGDVWYYDPLYNNGYNFGPLFGINPTADGSGNMGPVVGETGTFTEGMNFTGYTGENNYMDHISPIGTGFLIFYDSDDAYDCGVANDAVTYRTVGTSFELGLLSDGTPPSTREALLDSIMHFFGIYIYPGVEEKSSLSNLPLKTMLCTLYPNPFTQITEIRYQIADIANTENISLCIYDVTGRLVKQFNQLTTKPFNRIIWDTKDDLGRTVPAGIYFIRLDTGDYKESKKAILLK